MPAWKRAKESHFISVTKQGVKGMIDYEFSVIFRSVPFGSYHVISQIVSQHFSFILVFFHIFSNFIFRLILH